MAKSLSQVFQFVSLGVQVDKFLILCLSGWIISQRDRFKKKMYITKKIFLASPILISKSEIQLETYKIEYWALIL